MCGCIGGNITGQWRAMLHVVHRKLCCIIVTDIQGYVCICPAQFHERSLLWSCYTYMYVHINAFSSSPPSLPPPSLLCIAPLFAPNFTSSLVLSTSITLMWQPLTQEQARGNIAQYFIHWSGGPSLMLGPDTSSHQFSVEPSTTYNFTIAASTSGGTGPYSDTFTVTSQDGSKWSNRI